MGEKSPVCQTADRKQSRPVGTCVCQGYTREKHRLPLNLIIALRLENDLECVVLKDQILNKALRRFPNFRRHLYSPVVMTDDAFAIKRQMEGCTVLPVGSKDGRQSASITTRPLVELQNHVLCGVPRTCSGNKHSSSSACSSAEEECPRSIMPFGEWQRCLGSNSGKWQLLGR